MYGCKYRHEMCYKAPISCMETLPRDGSLRKWDVGKIGRRVTAQKEMTIFPEGLFSIEGKGKGWIFFGS